MKTNLSILPLLLFSLVPTCFGLESTKEVTVTASVGNNYVTIFGYTSPSSRVEMSSVTVFAATYSDDIGYFIFDKTLLPKNPSDLCFTSFDDNNRQSTPICIPPPPATNYQTNTGPIILPPTISTDNETIKPNSTLIASGQGIPNSQIDIFLYQSESKPFIFPKAAEAFGLPVFSTKSDRFGNYSFNLPTSFSSQYRLYSTVLFQNNPSPKSNTITYKLPSLWWLFWQENSYLIIFLPIFALSLSFFFYLIYLNYLLPKIRYLPAIFSYPLVIINHRGQ